MKRILNINKSRSCLSINENLVSSPGYHPILNTIRLGAAGIIL